MKQLYSWGLALSCFAGSLFAQDQALYEFHGKSHSNKDLSPTLQQAAYDFQHQAYENIQRVIDAKILEDYATEEAAKKKISVEEFQKKHFKGKEVSEKDAKKWFEENKARLGGREYDSIKTQIVQMLQNQEDEKERTKLLTKIKSDGKFKLLLAEPQAPVFQINTAGFPSKGNPQGKVTIVEFADFNCTHCKDAAKVMKKLVEKYKSKINFVFLDFPLNKNLSQKIAEGGVCAENQKKYWDYHYMAFEDKKLTDKSPVEIAQKLKLNMKEFEACLAAPETSKKVESARAEGERIGVDGTPAIYFNGRKVYTHDEEKLEASLKALL